MAVEDGSFPTNSHKTQEKSLAKNSDLKHKEKTSQENPKTFLSMTIHLN